jgi:hypothetical protein
MITRNTATLILTNFHKEANLVGGAVDSVLYSDSVC